MSIYLDTRNSIFTADKNGIQTRTADKKNFDEFEDSSGIEASSATTSTISINSADEVFKYGCNKIQSAEIFDLLAWWCQQKKEFPHIADLVYVIHAITASSETSETSFSAAGRVIRERRTYLRPNTK